MRAKAFSRWMIGFLAIVFLGWGLVTPPTGSAKPGSKFKNCGLVLNKKKGNTLTRSWVYSHKQHPASCATLKKVFKSGTLGSFPGPYKSKVKPWIVDFTLISPGSYERVSERYFNPKTKAKGIVWTEYTEEISWCVNCEK